jgi:hypothetical protein
LGAFLAAASCLYIFFNRPGWQYCFEAYASKFGLVFEGNVSKYNSKFGSFVGGV